MAFLSLMDAARRMDPDGEIDTIAELLSQANEFFQDMTWTESNMDTGHKSTVRTGLPSGTWRIAYAGVPYARSTTAQITDGLGFLSAYSQIDKRVADLGGKVAQIRMTEDSAFLEGLSQQMATTFWYGNTGTVPSQFNGFSIRFNTTSTATAANAVNVLSAGGTASANASLWLVGWGDMTNFGIYPKGSKAGLVFEDRGDIVPGYDASNNPFPAYTSYFEWNAGLVTKPQAGGLDAVLTPAVVMPIGALLISCAGHVQIGPAHTVEPIGEHRIQLGVLGVRAGREGLGGAEQLHPINLADRHGG